MKMQRVFPLRLLARERTRTDMDPKQPIFCGLGEELLAQYRAAYTEHVDSMEQTIERFDALLQRGAPFNFIRVSDTDALLLLGQLQQWEQHKRTFDNLLFWSGVQEYTAEDAQQFLQIMKESTITGVQEPTMGPPHFWCPLFCYLNEAGQLGARRWNSLHAIYRYISEGRLSEYMAGRRIVIVGGKAGLFRDYFYRNNHWNNAFPFLRFREIDLVDVIPTPDLPESSFKMRKEIEARVRASYSLKPDFFLLSSGLCAKFLSYQVTQENGSIGLDIGNALESIMNLQCKRPFMERFRDYEHPTHTFRFLPHLRVEVVPKVESTAG